MQSLNIWEAAKENSNFRKVLYTNSHSQLVLMSVEAGDDIGKEVHHVDQVLVFVSGTCRAEIDGEQKEVGEGEVVVVPAGATHNFVNIGSEPLKLFTVYAPAEHPDGIIHATKAEAEEAEHV